MPKNYSLLELIKQLGDNKIASITTLFVAIVGCVATIIAAIITGFFGYLGDSISADTPNSTTQTVESSAPGTNITSAPTDTPYSVVIPTQTQLIQAINTPVSELVLLPTDTPAAEIDSVNWSGIITYSLFTPCAYHIIPSDLHSGNDQVAWIQDNFQYLLDNQDAYLYSVYPVSSGTFSVFIDITHIPNEQYWVKLDNDLSVMVSYLQEVKQDVAIYRQVGCGGGGFIRYFTDVNLQSDHPEYIEIITTSDADFFTLEPGETETFNLTFKCQAPGIYRLRISVPISYMDAKGTLDITDIGGIVCPESVSAYDVDGYDENWIVISSASYYWNGSEYIQK